MDNRNIQSAPCAGGNRNLDCVNSNCNQVTTGGGEQSPPINRSTVYEGLQDDQRTVTGFQAEMPGRCCRLLSGKRYYPADTADGAVMPDKRTWGGRREGAGRPVSDTPKRARRAVEYFDEEWELIKAKAQKRGMSVREYLFFLADSDTG